MKKIFLILLFLMGSQVSFAQISRQEIAKLYRSLTGIYPSNAKVDLYSDYASGSGVTRETLAEKITLEADFYDVMLKGFVTPFSSQNADRTAPLNDMTALMVGIVRDNIPFNQIFFGDIYYIFKGVTLRNQLSPEVSALLQSGESLRVNTPELTQANANIDFTTQTAEQRHTRLTTIYGDNDRVLISLPENPKVLFAIRRISEDSNIHYEEAEKVGLSFLNPSFVRVKQSDYLHADSRAIAGIMSTRAFGKSYLVAGTNRAAVSYLVEHLMCRNMNQLKDNSISDVYITRDIPRIPGGVAKNYKNDCMTCHTGLDPLRQAFAYHDYTNERLKYNYGSVVSKINSVISNDDGMIGHSVASDYWVNFWSEGLNANMKWGPQKSGYGVRSLGQMFAETEAFSLCMGKRVLEKVCFGSTQEVPISSAEVASLASEFKKSNFNMRKLFAKASVRCEEYEK